MSDEQKQLIRENGIKELSEEVNGKPLNFVIGQYVERKDVGGLAEFFRAYISDAKETLEKYVDLAIKQTEERMVEMIDHQAHFSKLAGSKYDGYVYYKDLITIIRNSQNLTKE